MKIDTHDRIISIVTGGAGFIGSHLVDRLLKEGHFVIIVDNMCTGNIMNLQHIYNSEDSKYIFPFVGNACWGGIDSYFDECFPGRKIDRIYYLASPASPVHYLKMPLETIYANTIGLENFLKMARKHHCPILFSSTSEIYGDPEVMPQKETYNGNVNPLTNRSVYDEAKRMGETLMATYHREFGVDAIIARIFNTYGPRMQYNDGRVIPAFIHQVLNGEPVQIMGDGNQTRSFCYIDDTVEGLYCAMETGFSGEAYNVGDPAEYYSIKQLADKIFHLFGYQTGKTYGVFHSQNDPKVRRPDCTKLNQRCGFCATTRIDDGLKATIEYFRNRRSNGLDI